MNAPHLNPYFQHACSMPFTGLLLWTSQREGSHLACKGDIPHAAPPG